MRKRNAFQLVKHSLGRINVKFFTLKKTGKLYNNHSRGIFNIALTLLFLGAVVLSPKNLNIEQYNEKSYFYFDYSSIGLWSCSSYKFGNVWND